MSLTSDDRDAAPLTPDTIRRLRLLSLMFGLLTAIAAIAIAVRGSGRPVIGNQSIASGMALCIALLASAALLIAWRASDPTWRRLALRWDRWRNAPTNLGTRGQFLTLFALAFACQAILIASHWRRNRVAVDDQADYLRVATEISEQWGATGLPLALFHGEFVESNRHPLYVALLSLRPTFEFGKAISVFFAFAVTLMAGAIAHRAYGPSVAGWTVVLIAVNAPLLDSATLVACETLLTTLALAAWAVVLFTKEDRPLGALSLGALFGLAHLAKASAFFLFVGTLVGMALDRRSSLRRRVIVVLLIVVGFVLVTAPLLVRNARVYGSPLHSYNTRLLFEDSYDAHLERPDLGFRGNLQRYWQEHSWSDLLARRLVGGLAVESFILVRSLGPTPLDSGRAIVGCCLASLAGAAMLADRRRFPMAMLTAWTLIFWLFFGWYSPIAASDRFVLLLTPPLLILASAGIVRVGSLARNELLGARLGWAAAATYVIAFTALDLLRA